MKTEGFPPLIHILICPSPISERMIVMTFSIERPVCIAIDTHPIPCSYLSETSPVSNE